MTSRVVGLDLGGDTARLVEARLVKGAVEIHRAAAVPVEELGATVAALRLSGAPVACGVTGRDMILRTTAVPPVPLWQVREHLAFEVDDIAEQSGDALRADFHLLDGVSAALDEDQALLALVRSAVVDERTAFLSAAKLRVTGLTPNAVALFNAVVATDGGDGTVLAVNLRGQHTDIALVRDGELLAARNLSGGGDTLTASVAEVLGVGTALAEKAKREVGSFDDPGPGADVRTEDVAAGLQESLRPLVGMLQSTLAVARNQLRAPDLEVDRVLLSGAGACVPGLERALSRTLGLPVERFDPTEGYVVGDAPALAGRGADFAVATGLAMMALLEDGWRIRIRSEAGERAELFRSRTSWLVASFVVLVLGLGVSAWRAHADHAAALADRVALGRRVESNQAAVRDHERDVAEARRLGARLAAVEEATAPGTGLLTVLALLEEHLPVELWVRSVRTVRAAEPDFGRGGEARPHVVVQGGGKEQDRALADAVVEVTTRLRAHPDVAGVLPHFATDARGDFGWELRVDTSVVPAAEGADEAVVAGADAAAEGAG